MAEEVLSSIRTVFAFGGEEKEVERYNQKLKMATKLGAKKGLISGILTGLLFFLLFAMYSVAFWLAVTILHDKCIIMQVSLCPYLKCALCNVHTCKHRWLQVWCISYL